MRNTHAIFLNDSSANCNHVGNNLKKELPIKAERYETFTCAHLDEQRNGTKPNNYTDYI